MILKRYHGFEDCSDRRRCSLQRVTPTNSSLRLYEGSDMADGGCGQDGLNDA